MSPNENNRRQQTMAATKLIPYKVQLHHNRDTSDIDQLELTDLQQYNLSRQTRLGQSGDKLEVSNIEDFGDLICSFCQHHETNLVDLGEEHDHLSNVTLALSSDWKPSKDSDWDTSEKVVEGNLYLGNYGVFRNLVNKDSGERREGGRDIDDAEEKPLYFMTYTGSKPTTDAYVLLERSPRYGAKEAFHAALRDWIQDKYSDQLDVSMTSVKTKEIFSKMREADRTVRLRLERDGSPEQLHSNFDPIFDQDDMKQAIAFRPQRGEDMHLVVDELEDWYYGSDAAFESIDGVSYNNIKITVEKNDSEETISLTKGETELRKNIDLSDVAEEGDVPVLSEISARAHSFLTTVTGGPTATTSLFR